MLPSLHHAQQWQRQVHWHVTQQYHWPDVLLAEEDLLQDVWVAMLARRSTAYATRICIDRCRQVYGRHNAHVHQWGRLTRHQPRLVDPVSTSVLHHLEVRELMRTLDAAQQQLFLALYEGTPLADVAVQQGVSRPCISQRVAQLRRQLQRKVQHGTDQSTKI